MTRLLYFILITLSISSPLLAQDSLLAPMSVDDFLKKYPVAPKKTDDPSTGSNKTGSNENDDFFSDSEITLDSNRPDPLPIKRPLPPPSKSSAKEVRVDKFKIANFLFINRISGNNQIIAVPIGTTSIIDNFKITAIDCKRRQMSDNAVYTPVEFKVSEVEEKKSLDESETLLYKNRIYLEMPGLNGFEHPIYDIRPVNCE